MYCVAGPDPAAQREPVDQLERPEQTAGGGEHQPGPQVHDPCAAVAGGLGRRPPSRGSARRGSPGPAGADSSMATPAGVAVVADGRPAEQRGHAVLGDGARPAPRSARRGCRGSPGGARRSTAGPRCRRRPGSPRRRRRRTCRGRSARRAGPSPARRARRAPADQAQHLVPAGPQVGDQGRSDQAGRTGHDDAHAAILSARAPARESTRHFAHPLRCPAAELIVRGVSGAARPLRPPDDQRGGRVS